MIRGIRSESVEREQRRGMSDNSLGEAYRLPLIAQMPTLRVSDLAVPVRPSNRLKSSNRGATLWKEEGIAIDGARDKEIR